MFVKVERAFDRHLARHRSLQVAGSHSHDLLTPSPQCRHSTKKRPQSQPAPLSLWYQATRKTYHCQCVYTLKPPPRQRHYRRRSLSNFLRCRSCPLPSDRPQAIEGLWRKKKNCEALVQRAQPQLEWLCARAGRRPGRVEVYGSG